MLVHGPPALVEKAPLAELDESVTVTGWYDEPLDVGAELRDRARRYVVERVEQPPNPNALGHAWAVVAE